MTGDPVPLTRVGEVSLLVLLPSLPQLHRRHWKHRRQLFFLQRRIFYRVRAVLSTVRAQELRESRGGRPGLPFSRFCGHKVTLHHH